MHFALFLLGLLSALITVVLSVGISFLYLMTGFSDLEKIKREEEK